jgi:hypothetical protein
LDQKGMEETDFQKIELVKPDENTAGVALIVRISRGQGGLTPAVIVGCKP